ncbi:MAG: hypothetical protein JWM55_1182 [Acidimicrobiaceae bacterium]|nr:hypothetical protein [Acidimicrobiaceae bacterium]
MKSHMNEEFDEISSQIRELLRVLRDEGSPQLERSRELLLRRNRGEEEWRRRRSPSEPDSIRYRDEMENISLIVQKSEDWLKANPKTDPNFFRDALQDESLTTSDAKLEFLKGFRDQLLIKVEISVPQLISIVDQLDDAVSALEETLDRDISSQGERRPHS